MRVVKVTSGSEAARLLNEVGRVMDAHAGVTIRRVDDATLEIDGAERRTVEEVLGVASVTWSTHVRIDG